MITKEKARKILKNNDEDFSNEEIEKILEELYRQAKITVNEFQKLTPDKTSKDGEK
ncbi:Ca2+-binding EF-hand superfamily protein [Chryseobacterium ginsenosidimutans]|uniref:hypothetical protein n=1 Tax=Chryseobacterium ginsenosidimutans TaxID=687846 RepID=UPI00277E7AB3|nr:hypothetical protein [Chryseobacterium ginsenosidimutans]MDQ0592191.1 Ca2+-binding EF-hand superfamily protein [Chryseobacterium ginsenosidimutans]